MIRPLSQTTGRDPRLDPRPGDVVVRQLKKVVAFREVRSRDGERVHYSPSHRPWVFADGVHLSGWAAWCKGALVISRAED